MFWFTSQDFGALRVAACPKYPLLNWKMKLSVVNWLFQASSLLSSVYLHPSIYACICIYTSALCIYVWKSISIDIDVHTFKKKKKISLTVLSGWERAAVISVEMEDALAQQPLLSNFPDIGLCFRWELSPWPLLGFCLKKSPLQGRTCSNQLLLVDAATPTHL